MLQCLSLVAYSSVIERNAYRAPVVPVVLPDDALTAQFPQPRIVVTARGDQIRTIRAKRAVPDPSLVPMQRRLEWEGRGVAFSGGRQRVAGRDVVR